MVGKLIVFEGINGCGKTTIIKEFVKNLNNDFEVIKFPNYNCPHTGDIIKRILNKSIHLNPIDELNLFITNMENRIMEIIHKLNSGTNIVLDRYILTSLVYNQNNLLINYQKDEKLNINKIDKIIKVLILDRFNKLFPKPDLIFIIYGNHLKKRIGLFQSILNKYRLKQKYYNNNNILCFNNFILFSELLNVKWIILDNRKSDKEQLYKIKQTIFNYFNVLEDKKSVEFF
jgi:thymidylate kinase